MDLRWILGPTFDSLVTRKAAVPAAPDAPAEPPKSDPTISLVSVDADAWKAVLGLPAYDPATSNVLGEARVYLVPSGHGRPLDGPGYRDSSYPFVSTGDISAVLTGGEASLDLPDVEPGDYFGQVVLGLLS